MNGIIDSLPKSGLRCGAFLLGVPLGRYVNQARQVERRQVGRWCWQAQKEYAHHHPTPLNRQDSLHTQLWKLNIVRKIVFFIRFNGIRII